MATTPMPNPADQQGGGPPQGGPPPGAAPPDQNGGQGQPQGQGPPDTSFQAPGNPLQMLLVKWGNVAKQMAAADPRLAAGAQKVQEGIRDMQTAIVTPQQPTPMAQQPQY